VRVIDLGRTRRRDRRFIREVAAASIVATFSVAVGLAIVSFHAASVRNGILERRCDDPPLVGLEPWDEEASEQHSPACRMEAESAIQQNAVLICNIIARPASYAQAPASGAAAHRPGLPC
jgi:hypothetical protein